MFNTQIHIPTLEAKRLIKRLCTHWAHKFTVEVSEHEGHIDFGTCQCVLSAKDQALNIQLNGADKNTLNNMQTVVFDHLQRMTRAPLPETAWSPVQGANSASAQPQGPTTN